MELYLAKVEQTCTPDDFRLTVRILPHLAEIQDTNDLPRFPAFFGNKGYTGKVDEVVWVTANEEFSMGYVMGVVNKFDWEEDYASQSVTKDNWDKISKASVQFGVRALPFTDLELIYWDNTCMHMINRRDGSLIIGYSSGSIHIVSETELLHIIPNAEDSTKSSVIQMTDSKISLRAEEIFINGKKVFLGRKSYGPLVVTQGSDTNVALAAEGVFA